MGRAKYSALPGRIDQSLSNPDIISGSFEISISNFDMYLSFPSEESMKNLFSIRIEVEI